MGLVYGGKVLKGRRGAAGEIGYFPLAMDPFGPEHRRRARSRTRQLARACSRPPRGGRAGRSRPRPRSRAFHARRGRRAPALAVVEREAQLLGMAVATVAAVIDPHLVVLGGGIGSNAAAPRPGGRGAAAALAAPRGVQQTRLRGEPLRGRRRRPRPRPPGTAAPGHRMRRQRGHAGRRLNSASRNRCPTVTRVTDAHHVRNGWTVPKLLVLTLALLVGACIGLWCVRRYQPRRPGSGLAKHAPAHIPVMLRLPRPGIRARWRGGLLVIDGDETRWRRRWQLRRRREITLGTLTRVERRGVLGSERWWLKSRRGRVPLRVLGRRSPTRGARRAPADVRATGRRLVRRGVIAGLSWRLPTWGPRIPESGTGGA